MGTIKEFLEKHGMTYKGFGEMFNPPKSKQYIWQLVHGERLAGEKIMAEIEAATNGEVTYAGMRPDLAKKFSE